MVKRNHVISQPGIRYGTVIIPLGRSVTDSGKHIESLPEMSALNIIISGFHMNRIFITAVIALRPSVALPAKAKAAEQILKITEASKVLIASSGASGGSAAPVAARSSLPFVHDSLISLLDFLELFLCLLLIRIIHIGIRMIFSA